MKDEGQKQNHHCTPAANIDRCFEDYGRCSKYNEEFVECEHEKIVDCLLHVGDTSLLLARIANLTVAKVEKLSIYSLAISSIVNIKKSTYFVPRMLKSTAGFDCFVGESNIFIRVETMTYKTKALYLLLLLFFS